MAKLNRTQIRDLACEIIRQNPGGIRYSDLKRQISEQHPETPPNTIQGSMFDIDRQRPNEVSKPSRGIFAPVAQGGVIVEPPTPPTLNALREADFYESFADYLKAELEEATAAFALGGTVLRGKWWTPDVIGVYKRLPSDRVPFEGEILAAEIKIDPQEYVTAFGQAVAYRLFAARTYIVMPSTMAKSDQGRLDALCMLYGIGFVLFDLNKDNPQFRVQVRAQRFPPDMFYLNKFADALHTSRSDVFNSIFPLQ